MDWGEWKARYEREGFGILRGALAPTLLGTFLRQVQEWADGCRPDPKNLRFRFKNVATGELALDAVDPVLDLFPELAEIASHPTILKTLETIHGEPVHLFKDKLILKEPGAAGYGLHQDFIAWPDFPRSFTTVVIPLEAANETNGCIDVYPGTHAYGLLSRPDGDFHDLSETAMRGVKPVALELNAGDIAIFGCFLPHASKPNRSRAPRRQLYLSYNRASELGDYRERHYESYRKWLGRRYQDFGAGGFYFD